MSTPRQHRIRLLDILRGFAILGTLGTNIWIFSHSGDLNAMLTDPNRVWWSSWDSILSTIVLFLVNGKFLGLLAIMFGVGLELKYQQSVRKGNPWPGMYIWISIILMIEGFLHFMLVMEYDILMSYALTAIIVAFIVRAGEKSIKKAMIIFGSFHVLAFLGILFLQFNGMQFTGGDATEVTALYQHGTWVEQILYRLRHFVKLRFELILAFSSNIFLFLTGVLLMRKGAFASDEPGSKIRSKMLWSGLLVGIPLNLLLLIPGGYFDIIVRYVCAPVMSLGYLGLFARLVDKRTTWRLWKWLERTGKMSLSCYVLQNVICSIIFYGWGIGLGGKVDSITIIGIWMMIMFFLMVFSSVWLRFFTLGPMEKARKAVTGIVVK
ncbi:DUF418 domain-containing protein [Paenibacillus favisporus]|uniref:DUF418 domain-containing protein n=1 Tax=Paenibacillus favisporus TaxID=221028 RepID=UPI002DB79397|nr:DUF418 domain-containing protein [Paenibacillus favisporus]MEC0175080.1 DUF418 domain-containing protein [Paenibacillus favisporus]